ncbi:hypothetical protein KC332_g14369 [Hortaea werneckii]|uniref:Uncharacterized protein n=2 Tax=Hortaea werneckii TaxID=91943 RepID=A0A3M7I5T3_HORWE|nr:hypothetical protein KC358_g11989 [Hortaea werneckii]OTA19086.1 hypothetical protein BTJ68_15294 [Hortaea werneckii EXF-2000]KAI6813770.1 hypothetical protein KC350_g11505 [Hortaea werneckii]KAI6915028.1 hypothetical protein KC348_g12141 [Hortaea werneckii]KAI6928214.1 hypothetical protein KC341_g11660 [Hortaea werneckii]
MLSPMYASGLALALSLVKADSPTETTATTPLGSLYAYGSGISGLPIISSDGVAVLGWGQPAVATIATNLTFTHANSSLVAEPNNTAVASNWTTPLLCIETQPGAKSDVTFASSDISPNDTRVCTGFEFYGRQLLWLGSDEDAGVGRSFWASPLNGSSEFYKLFWNSDNTATEGTVPVAIKKMPPPSLP